MYFNYMFFFFLRWTLFEMNIFLATKYLKYLLFLRNLANFIRRLFRQYRLQLAHTCSIPSLVITVITVPCYSTKIIVFQTAVRRTLDERFFFFVAALFNPSVRDSMARGRVGWFNNVKLQRRPRGVRTTITSLRGEVRHVDNFVLLLVRGCTIKLVRIARNYKRALLSLSLSLSKLSRAGCFLKVRNACVCTRMYIFQSFSFFRLFTGHVKSVCDKLRGKSVERTGRNKGRITIIVHWNYSVLVPLRNRRGHTTGSTR